MNNSNKDFAILVLSCDRYADLWGAFYSLFFNALGLDKYRIYHGSNTVKCSDDRVVNLLSGKDENWSTSYIKILNQIPEESLFVILEDVFIEGVIDIEKFKKCIQLMRLNHVRHIKYFPNPRGDSGVDEIDFLSAYNKGAPYRVTVCGFWNKKTLLELLIPGENPWNFEINGSYRSSYSDGYYCLKDPLFSFKNMVEKGMWIRKSIKWAMQKNIVLDYKKRPHMSILTTIFSNIKMLYFNFILKINWRLRLKIINLFKKLLAVY
ncbi:hypothetical protein [Polynucleobacter sp. MWH-UH35A]|uniref:hypothetical protein n=1 Tax=Polynucleobacter sp. MWH-UH35A TaxID=1855619 RepID=UPI001BFD664E|nr:hypothetical protein [Polynucleobacter sp. MWH-UH35A]QWD60459.1 hypothetical protein ICV36_01835 [Polynucleobacter sp. MWH-UH35A]